ncbi:extradiol ring-cleavage dioxygenase-like [Spodoptera litura]|uniref:Extradiol ring-cleavage dioxygenase-like n=1 Tax=Spodoptera litura TaxID=69820 RepID=A0A9J7IKX1_SPOLT|nr:extradiol ring-cleavage dioxygenase-like [Spodoptera litura]
MTINKLIFGTFTVIIFNFITKIKMEDVYFAPSLFLNHGGGPYPVLGEKYNLEIGEALKNVSNYVDLSRLKAIVVVTAHREEDVVTISSAERHSLVYDYYNFPPESYEFQYNAPGDPVLAARIHEAFRTAGIESRLDDQRGWDHGVFIPMMLVNPKADIPIIQISILKNQNAVQHYEIGRVLYQFRKEGVAIFGSGLSYHNMGEFRKAKPETEKDIVNTEFDRFLNEVCTGDEENRKKIVFWEQEKGGYDSHPLGEADHLMPLIVNAGAGGTERGRNIFNSVFLGKFKISGFVWDS